MRTTLDLEDSLMEALMARHPGKSKTQAVEQAIREYLRNDAAARFEALRGNVQIEDVSAELRKADVERQERLRKMWNETD